MHLSIFLPVAITALTQLATCQSIDPSEVPDTTKGEIGLEVWVSTMI